MCDAFVIFTSQQDRVEYLVLILGYCDGSKRLKENAMQDLKLKCSVSFDINDSIILCDRKESLKTLKTFPQIVNIYFYNFNIKKIYNCSCYFTFV